MSPHISCPFKNWIILFYLFFSCFVKSSSCSLDMIPWPDVVFKFFPSCGFSFHPFNKIFQRGKVFNIEEVQVTDC